MPKTVTEKSTKQLLKKKKGENAVSNKKKKKIPALKNKIINWQQYI